MIEYGHTFFMKNNKEILLLTQMRIALSLCLYFSLLFYANIVISKCTERKTKRSEMKCAWFCRATSVFVVTLHPLTFFYESQSSSLQATKAVTDWYKLSSHCNKKYVSDYFYTGVAIPIN